MTSDSSSASSTTSTAPTISSPVASPAPSTIAVPSPTCPPPLPHEPVQDWAFLRHAIQIGHIGALARTASQLALYNEWAAAVRPVYGSVGGYVIRERLKWTPRVDDGEGEGEGELRFEMKSAVPFEREEDYVVLRNDWPYGLEEGVFHVCVWLKNRLDFEGPRGAMTRETWGITQEFVERTFMRPMVEAEERATVVRSGREEFDEWDLTWESNTNAGGDGKRVIWFKNWVELQSVRGLDHVHVLLRDPAPELVQRWIK